MFKPPFIFSTAITILEADLLVSFAMEYFSWDWQMSPLNSGMFSSNSLLKFGLKSLHVLHMTCESKQIYKLQYLFSKILVEFFYFHEYGFSSFAEKRHPIIIV